MEPDKHLFVGLLRFSQRLWKTDQSPSMARMALLILPLASGSSMGGLCLGMRSTCVSKPPACWISFWQASHWPTSLRVIDTCRPKARIIPLSSFANLFGISSSYLPSTFTRYTLPLTRWKTKPSSKHEEDRQCRQNWMHIRGFFPLAICSSQRSTLIVVVTPRHTPSEL